MNQLSAMNPKLRETAEKKCKDDRRNIRLKKKEEMDKKAEEERTAKSTARAKTEVSRGWVVTGEFRWVV
jgi:hypothetical protein